MKLDILNKLCLCIGLFAVVNLPMPINGKQHSTEDSTAEISELNLPRFAEPIPNITVTIGKDALLACVVDNLKSYRVAWVRVDTQTILSIHHNLITQNHRISLTHNDHRSWYLHIKEVEEDDRGWYMCQINTDPMRSRKGYLQVVVPPMIVESSTSNDMVVREGSNVTLICKAKGYPEPYVMWRREDGDEITISGQSVNLVDGEMLTITKVSRLHMAPYLCVASNGVPPSISKRVLLRVQFPPMLSIPNQLEAAYQGQDVTLECQTEAYPASINYWTTEKGDMIISAEPKFSGPIQNATVAVGRDAVLTCMVEDLGAFKVAWLRVDTQTILTIQNHVITKNHRISILHSEHKTWQLKIKDIRESDRGFYMCQINVDPMKSQTGYLDVVVPPDILDFPTSTDMVVNENSNITLICEAKGSPKPNITWKREGPTANHPAVVFAEGPTLPIARVDRTHMGSFLCIASNGVPPSVSKRITLIVHFSPMISIQNQLVGAYEGQSVTLHCSTEAYPKSINYWTFSNNNNINSNNNNILVSGGNFESILNESTYKTDMTLRIKSVGPNDFGSYKCIAKNSLGETDSTIKLYKIPKNTLNSIDTQEKPYRDLMRDERNGHSIKISSNAWRPHSISTGSIAIISMWVTMLSSMLWTTKLSL